MKNPKMITAVCTALLFVPWTILPLRTFDWALESPTAEIMIGSYAVIMILGGVFTAVSYARTKARSSLMKFCLMVNLLYAAGGIAALGMIALPG